MHINHIGKIEEILNKPVNAFIECDPMAEGWSAAEDLTDYFLKFSVNRKEKKLFTENALREVMTRVMGMASSASLDPDNHHTTPSDTIQYNDRLKFYVAGLIDSEVFVVNPDVYEEEYGWEQLRTEIETTRESVRYSISDVPPSPVLAYPYTFVYSKVNGKNIINDISVIGNSDGSIQYKPMFAKFLQTLWEGCEVYTNDQSIAMIVKSIENPLYAVHQV